MLDADRNDPANGRDSWIFPTREHPKEPEWPEAEFIVGNPPFLGGKLLRKNLGDEYVDAMFKLWGERVPREADLCCYWFERRRMIQLGKCRRAGLATQGIRGGANRKVLERIKETGDIFFARRPRMGAGRRMVHISMEDLMRAKKKTGRSWTACRYANPLQSPCRCRYNKGQADRRQPRNLLHGRYKRRRF